RDRIEQITRTAQGRVGVRSCLRRVGKNLEDKLVDN
ncbi:MAG: hypothetical protein RLZZ574_3084, partial [Cyanobacteriota bacterium]